jgi:tripartite-type tricarboxylate transporter receptor subunit TctC
MSVTVTTRNSIYEFKSTKVTRINALVNQALEHPDVKTKLATLACDPAPSTPEAFATRVTADVARWKKLASERNIRAD